MKKQLFEEIYRKILNEDEEDINEKMFQFKIKDFNFDINTFFNSTIRNLDKYIIIINDYIILAKKYNDLKTLNKLIQIKKELDKIEEIKKQINLLF